MMNTSLVKHYKIVELCELIIKIRTENMTFEPKKTVKPLIFHSGWCPEKDDVRKIYPAVSASILIVIWVSRLFEF